MYRKVYPLLRHGLTTSEVLNPLHSYLLASNTRDPANYAPTTLSYGLRHGKTTAGVLGGANEAQTQLGSRPLEIRYD